MVYKRVGESKSGRGRIYSGPPETTRFGRVRRGMYEGNIKRINAFRGRDERTTQERIVGEIGALDSLRTERGFNQRYEEFADHLFTASELLKYLPVDEREKYGVMVRKRAERVRDKTRPFIDNPDEPLRNNYVFIYESAERAIQRTDSYVPRREESQLASAVVALTGLIGGAFFFSTNITGNVVGLSNGTSSIIGVALLIIGFVAGYFWAKSKRNSKELEKKIASVKKKAKKK